MILSVKLFDHVYNFSSLKEVMAKANEKKSGDELAAIPASVSPDFLSLAFAITSFKEEKL